MEGRRRRKRRGRPAVVRVKAVTYKLPEKRICRRHPKDPTRKICYTRREQIVSRRGYERKIGKYIEL